MEIILALVAIGLAGYWFWYRNQSETMHQSSKTEDAPAPTAPYKIETPAPEAPRCGCGRSQTGFCVGLHKLTPEQWAMHADNPLRPAATPARDTKPVKKPAARKTKVAADPKPEKPAPAKKVAAKKTVARKTKV
jgi:hypothetical protein